MRTLYFLRGLPASGKTTWAIQKLSSLNRGGKINAIRTSKDEIRIQIGAEDGNREALVMRLEAQLVTEALKAGVGAIIDNTHFNPSHERKHRWLAEKYGYRFEIKNFTDVSLEECICRDRNRLNPVGEAVIRRMHDKYLCSGQPASPAIKGRLLQ